VGSPTTRAPLVARSHQLGDAAAEHGLLAEQVGLGLVLEGRLDHAGAGAADALRVGEHEVAGLAAGVAVDGDQAGDAVPLDELAPHQVAGALRRHHAHANLGARVDLPEVDREPVGEHQQVAGGDPVADLLLEHLGLLLVRQKDHHEVALARSVGDRLHAHSVALRLVDRRGVLPQPDDHVYARVLQIQRVGVPL
jgi:hypothetical protein